MITPADCVEANPREWKHRKTMGRHFFQPAAWCYLCFIAPCAAASSPYTFRGQSQRKWNTENCVFVWKIGEPHGNLPAATQKSAVIVKCRKWPKRLFSHSTKASLQPNKKSWRRSFQVLLSYESGWRTSRCPGRPGRHACLPEIWSNGVNRHTDYTVYVGKRGRRPAMDVGKIKTGLGRLVSYLPFIPHMSVQVPGFH